MIKRQEVNFKDDFNFILTLRNYKGEDIGFPDYDFTVNLYTLDKSQAFVASSVNGVLTNLFNDDGRIHVVCNDHGLKSGQLKAEFIAELPDGMYPDDYEHKVIPDKLNIYLIRTAADIPTEMEAELILPFIKGEAFTYDDFTPEQIEGLRRPAAEAAEEARLAVEALVGQAGQDIAGHIAESGKKIDGAIREVDTLISDTKSELAQARTEAAAAAEAESLRAEAETARQGAETRRAADEDRRAKAESLRAEEFAAYKPQIDSKQDRLVDSADITVGEDCGLSLTERAKREVFVGLWNTACGSAGRYNTETGYFELNGLTDLTYGEALAVYEAGKISNSNTVGYYMNSKIRTNLPQNINQSVSVCGYTFKQCKNIEVVSVPYLLPAEQTFNGCAKLREAHIYSPNCNEPTRMVNTWAGCAELRTISGMRRTFSSSFSLADSPLISAETLSKMAENKIAADVPKQTTVTVHPDVYAKLTDETNTEWHKVLTAADKNITFATTE